MKRSRDNPIPAEPIWFMVPLVPPSGNHYRKPVRRGNFLGWYLTPEAKAFKEAVYVLSARRKIRASAYEVEIHVHPGKGKRGDLDNFAKVTIDALVAAGTIDTDAKVVRIVMEKRRDWEQPRTEITVRAYGQTD